MEFTDELGVRHTVQPGTRIDALNPKGTEIALPAFAADVGITKCFFD